MIEVMQYLEAIAVSSQPLLIIGGTGTRRKLLAQSVHKIGDRKGKFVTVNVADDQMLTDVLFGNINGAFSGADQRRKGLLEQAAGGTLFMDDIGSLHEVSQSNLLRLLSEREFYPLGSDTPMRTDARIIAATNRDLRCMVQVGDFRSDLYYRLFAHQIKIPPRERTDDISLLPEYFLQDAAEALGKKKPTPPPELSSYLKSLWFPRHEEHGP
jgi:two-component system response regulator HydG